MVIFLDITIITLFPASLQMVGVAVALVPLHWICIPNAKTQLKDANNSYLHPFLYFFYITEKQCSAVFSGTVQGISLQVLRWPLASLVSMLYCNVTANMWMKMLISWHTRHTVVGSVLCENVFSRPLQIVHQHFGEYAKTPFITKPYGLQSFHLHFLFPKFLAFKELKGADSEASGVTLRRHWLWL